MSNGLYNKITPAPQSFTVFVFASLSNYWRVPRPRVSASTAASYVGFALMAAGVWVIFGVGWACLGSGALLFVAGNLAETKQR